MRANGMFVAGYTRSLPGSGSKARKSTTTTQKYSCLRTDSDGSTASPPVQAKLVQVRGYTSGSDGTYVAGYTRFLPSPKGNSGKNSVAMSNGSSSLVFSDQKSYQPWPTNPSRGTSSGNVVHVRGYTRSDGTRVASHTRSAPTKSSKKRVAVLPVPASSVPVTSMGGGAQAAESARRHPKDLHQQPLLDTTNTTTARRKVQQSKQQHSPPLAVYGGARHENCPTTAQTAVQGIYLTNLRSTVVGDCI